MTTRTKGTIRWAGVFTAASALFHLLGTGLSGFAADGLALLPAGVLYAGLAYGLFRGQRWVAHITFIVLLIGTSFAVSGIWATGGVPSWVYTAIAAANLLAVAALFVTLWRSPKPAG